MRQTHAMVMSGTATQSDPIPYSRLAARYRVIAYLAAVSPLLLMLVLAFLYRDPNRTGIADSGSLISAVEEKLNREVLPNASPKVQSPHATGKTSRQKS